MMKIRRAWLTLSLVAPTVASCALPPLPELAVTLELLAGDIGGAGNGDGTGDTARFNGPRSIAVDGDGNVYVADQGNHTIRKIAPTGVVTTLAGVAGLFDSDDSVSGDGPGDAARFYNPSGMAVDSDGNVYVADTNTSTIRKITPTGVVTTLAGTAHAIGSTDDAGPAARFNRPSGVVVDGDSNIYVADQQNHTIRKITSAGVVTTVAGTADMPGSADGMGTAARFNDPSAIALDGIGNVYVADQKNHTIRKIDMASDVTTLAGDVTTLAGMAGTPGSANGTGADARFNGPAGVAVDRTGNVYVADQENHTIRKITPTGEVTTLAGSPGMRGRADGLGGRARFDGPSGVAIDGNGDLRVADQRNHTIRKVTAGGDVTTVAGAAPVLEHADGTGSAARFREPTGVAVDGDGNVYVADRDGQSIRKVTPEGVVTTLVANIPGPLVNPTGLALDTAGNLYVAVQGLNTIAKVTAGGAVTTLAGTASEGGSNDGTGSAARFNLPSAVATDSAGNVYVADTNNSTIRKITPQGVVTTLAGQAGVHGHNDGPAADASFAFPTSIAVDSAGNVYVTSNQTIRKVTAEGVVSTLAGRPDMLGSTDGAGDDARFYLPRGIAVDRTGNVYVADSANSTIRRITPDGTTTRIAGSPRMSGVVLGAAPRLASPHSLAIVGDSIVISDATAILVFHHAAQ